jgi:hypothetical protein
MILAQNGQWGMVKNLIECDADINVQGEQFLSFAIAKYRRHRVRPEWLDSAYASSIVSRI